MPGARSLKVQKLDIDLLAGFQGDWPGYLAGARVPTPRWYPVVQMRYPHLLPRIASRGHIEDCPVVGGNHEDILTCCRRNDFS
jgi:hypothetical protein